MKKFFLTLVAIMLLCSCKTLYVYKNCKPVEGMASTFVCDRPWYY